MKTLLQKCAKHLPNKPFVLKTIKISFLKSNFSEHLNTSGVIELVSYFIVILLLLRIIRYLLYQYLINELYSFGVVVLVVYYIYFNSLVICVFSQWIRFLSDIYISKVKVNPSLSFNSVIQQLILFLYSSKNCERINPKQKYK